jgi:hypothetical protein
VPVPEHIHRHRVVAIIIIAALFAILGWLWWPFP